MSDRWTISVCCVSALVGVLAAPSTGAQTKGEVLRQGTAHEAVYDIALRGNEGIAVGALGDRFISADGGRTWSRAPQRLGDLALLAVALSERDGLIVGQEGAIYRREGDLWKAVDSGTRQRLLNVALNDGGLAVAVGGFGTLLRSTDAGHNWQAVSLDWQAILGDFLEPHLYDVTINANGVITVVGEFELILRSLDGGQEWQVVHKGEASIFALDLLEDGVGYAVGQNGLILRTGDGGLHWAPSDPGTGANYLGVLVQEDGAVYATGIRSLVTSRDDGRSWQSLAVADITTGWYQALAGGTDGRIVTVGHHGQIVEISPSGGSTP
ncbi:MAG: WD40/YVTN/BNR-like repeat-containing protein [Pseudomonadota bacterium]